MSEQGIDAYGAKFKRTSDDFLFRWLEEDNYLCNICHGTGAKIELQYFTRNYASARRRNVICKTLQTHEHSFWICPKCLDNLKRAYEKMAERREGDGDDADGNA